MKQLLVIVDMQNDFITGALGSDDARAIVDKVVNRIETWSGDIVVTLDTHTKDYLNTQEGRNLPVPHCIEGTEGHELHPAIKEALAVSGKYIEVFKKPTFGSAALQNYLTKAGYAYIEFVGLCTDICVVSNAMLAKTAVPEAEITVNAECCAGVSRETHNAALQTMSTCQISVINCAE